MAAGRKKPDKAGVIVFGTDAVAGWTMRQLEAQLMMRNYEGFAKGRRLRSRRG